MTSFYYKFLNNNKGDLFLISIFALFYFMGIGEIHLFDWDEINFAESSREMFLSRDFLHVQINYEPFWEKPPLFFWLQALSMSIFGVSEFAARFPNAMFGFIYLITLYSIGKKHFDRKFGLIWTLLFTASLLPHIYFKSGIIDPVFNYFIFLSVYFMLLVVGKAPKYILWFAILSGIFSGIALLTKGPVGFLILGLCFLFYITKNRFRILPNIKHLLLFFVGFFFIISSWLLTEYFQNGADILIQFIEYQIDLFRSPVAGHAQPFYYHFVVVFIGCFPISILALPNLFKSKDSIGFDLDKWMRILFWVVLILFTIVTTKIIHYSSMAYLPLSFLAAQYLHAKIVKQELMPKALNILLITIGSLIGIGIFTVIFIVVNKSYFDFLFTNDFVKASMGVNPYWFGWEPTIGLVFIFGIIWSVRSMIKAKYFYAVFTLAFFTSFTLLLIQLFFIPKLEEHTQGPLIEMCEYADKNDAIIISYGFKSYAPFFYGKVSPRPSEEKEMQWLQHSKTEKTILFVSKINNTDLDENPSYKLILKKGGYKLFRRETSP